MKKKLLFLLLACAFAFTESANAMNYRIALVMAYSPVNSVYEDDNVKFEIYNEQLWATNKTNKTIFIDLSQCFLVNNGSSYPIGEEHQDENDASKVKVSTSIDRFISIAPSIGSKQNETFICYLGGTMYGKYTSTESPTGNFSEYDERMLVLVNELFNESRAANPKNKPYFATASRHLTEDESISNIGASISYAFNKRSEDWTPVTISTWVSDVYLAPYYIEMPKELTGKEKRGFGVKKADATKLHIRADSPFEFEQDKSPVIVCDWEGDFKKGEFYLYPTWIPKDKELQKKLVDYFNNLFNGKGDSSFLNKLDKTYCKKSILFEGTELGWGKMTYMKKRNLTQFNND